jgi:hypothetical protein
MHISSLPVSIFPLLDVCIFEVHMDPEAIIVVDKSAFVFCSLFFDEPLPESAWPIYWRKPGGLISKSLLKGLLIKAFPQFYEKDDRVHC